MASMSSGTLMAFLLLAHGGLILANELVHEHDLDNQQSSANKLVREHVLGNQQSSANELVHEQDQRNQQSLANGSGLNEAPVCPFFEWPEVPSRDMNCPPPENIPGCSCSQEVGEWPMGSREKSLEVICSKYVDIKRAFVSLRTPSIRKLILRNCHHRLPAGLFSYLDVYELQLDESCSIQFMSPENEELPFRGLENVLQMLVHDAAPADDDDVSSELTSVRLSHLERLGWLQIFNFRLPVIGPDFFRGGAPGCLHFLDIRWDGVEHVADGAFTGLHNLKRLILSDNKLRTFSRAWLKLPALKLNELSLDNNKLQHMPVDSFSGMPALKTINLSYNSIRHIPESTWSPIWNQLDLLDLFQYQIADDVRIEVF